MAASNTLGTPLFTQQAGAAFAGAQGLFADHLSEQMRAMREVNRFLTAEPLDSETEMAALSWLMMLPLGARRVMLGRDADHRSHYAQANVPILVSHGKDDQIVIPRAAEMLKETAPAVMLSWYDQVGHAPNWEGRERFNSELFAFARSI